MTLENISKSDFVLVQDVFQLVLKIRSTVHHYITYLYLYIYNDNTGNPKLSCIAATKVTYKAIIISGQKLLHQN